MTHRNFKYSLGNYNDDITLDLRLSDRVKISDEVIDKALMIAVNYLIENMETEEHEEPKQGSSFISSSTIYTS